MQPVNDAPNRPDRQVLRRYGPLAVVMAVVAALVGLSFAGDGEGGGDERAAGEGTGSTIPSGELPEGVITWGMAQDQDLDATFPDTCDSQSGMVAIPFFFRAECVAESEVDGGESAAGVTS
ncbi:MAG TPA: hypothetical protein VFZ79_07305, partial [Acidimicrobiales bacterium]